MAVQTQSAEVGYEEYIENVMWTSGGVVYATVHLLAVTRSPSSEDVAAQRMGAAIAWIAKAFELAQANNGLAVFVATQVDPWPVSGRPPLEPRASLEPLYPLLVERSDAFDGQVVLAVGDTHIFRVDKPLYRADGSLVENFTRVETFGDPLIHWVRVTVDPTDRQVFTFRQELVPGNDASTAAT